VGKRIVLFLLTNLAVMVVLGIVLSILRAAGLLEVFGEQWTGLLVFAALWGFGGSFISLWMSKSIAMWSTGAQIIPHARNQDEAWLLETVQRQAQAAGIGTPQLALYPSNDMNAFATGASRNNALVAVSTGLLSRMKHDQIEAVLAHEISHIANGDMVTLTLIQGTLNTFVIFLSRAIGFLVDSWLSRGSERRTFRGPGYWITVIVMEIALGILATIIVMWFSRQREFRADEGAAHLAGPDKMAEALRRLQTAHEPAALPDSIRAFGIRGGAAGLFRSHPPIEERIARMEQIARSLVVR
jgi:heat shock protein HtpX